MSTLANIEDVRAVDVRIEQNLFYVRLEDGRDIGVPYNWYERLEQASMEQRKNWRFIGNGSGIHWEELDEDLSVLGLLQGKKKPDATKVE